MRFLKIIIVKITNASNKDTVLKKQISPRAYFLMSQATIKHTPDGKRLYEDLTTSHHWNIFLNSTREWLLPLIQTRMPPNEKGEYRCWDIARQLVIFHRWLSGSISSHITITSEDKIIWDPLIELILKSTNAPENMHPFDLVQIKPYYQMRPIYRVTLQQVIAVCRCALECKNPSADKEALTKQLGSIPAFLLLQQALTDMDSFTNAVLHFDVCDGMAIIIKHGDSYTWYDFGNFSNYNDDVSFHLFTAELVPQYTFSS